MTENSALAVYFKKISSLPLLSQAEESALFARIGNGDMKARDELIERNIRLVIPMARRYSKCGVPFGDLVQEGSVAIVMACDKFDPSLGNRFSTYATCWIKQRISRYVKKHSKNVFVPEHVVNLAVQIAKARRMLAHEFGCDPNVEQIVECLRTTFDVDTDFKSVKSALESCQIETSLSAKIGDDKDTDFGDLIEDASAPDPSVGIENDFMAKALESAVNSLSATEQDVMFLRYGVNGSGNRAMSVTEIAQKFGVPADEIREIARSAFAKYENPNI